MPAMKLTCLPMVMLFAAVACSGDGGSVSLLIDGEDVACTRSSSSGQPMDGTRICQVDFSECSDDHVYTVACGSLVDSGRSDCSCYIDTVYQGAEIDLSHECPVDATTVAQACGWMK
jgi:hypothetical protein